MDFYTIEDGPDRIGVGVDLDDEPEGVDLTADGLGDALIDLAVAGMLRAVDRRQNPRTGADWAPDAPSTKRKKGHGIVGFETGRMGQRSNWEPGDRDVIARSAKWYWSGPVYGIYFHLGVAEKNQPPRPIVGWSPEAEGLARKKVEEAAEEID